MRKHLVFYDGQCGFCDRAVSQLLRLDRKVLFVFAPLQGQTAKRFLGPGGTSEETMVLIENFEGETPKMYLLGQAALRCLWLVGGIWTVPGLLSFLPKFLINPAYRFVARHRHRLFRKESCRIPDSEQMSRFLP